MKPTYITDSKHLQTLTKKYCNEILTNKIPCSQPIKNMVKRFLKHSKDKTLYIDWDNAYHCCNFFQLFKHRRGRFHGQRFILSDFQFFFIVNVIGLKEKKTKTRYYDEAVMHIPRKNGKSYFCAVLTIYLTTNDNNFGAKNQLLSPSKDSTEDNIFLEIQLLCKQYDPTGDKIQVFKESIYHKKSQSYCNVKSLNAKDIGEADDIGMWLIDEYQHCNNPIKIQNLKMGQSLQSNPLGILIYTAGSIMVGNIPSPAHQKVKEGEKVMSGELDENRTFYMLWNLDEGDQWEDPSVVAKCNPNIDITVPKSRILEKLKAAKTDPTVAYEYQTKILNKFVEPDQHWISKTQLEPIIIEPDEFDHNRIINCWCGLDLAATKDITAAGYLYELEDGSLVFDCDFYLPLNTIQTTSNTNYQQWVNDGYLTATPGNLTDYNRIEQDINMHNQQFPIDQILYDSWNSSQLINNLTVQGYTCTVVKQNTYTQHITIRQIEQLIDSKQLYIINNPVLLWMFSNVRITTDKHGNNMFDKKNKTGKIDGVIALYECVACWIMLNQQQPAPPQRINPYEDPNYNPNNNNYPFNQINI